jgi:hypothetical protein
MLQRVLTSGQRGRSRGEQGRRTGARTRAARARAVHGHGAVWALARGWTRARGSGKVRHTGAELSGHGANARVQHNPEAKNGSGATHVGEGGQMRGRAS